MPKCNFNRHGCSPVDLLHIFRTTFTKNLSGWLLLTMPSASPLNVKIIFWRLLGFLDLFGKIFVITFKFS